MARPRAVCFDAYGTLVVARDPVGRLAELLAAALDQPIGRDLAGDAFAAEVALYRRISIEGADEPRRATMVRRCAAELGRALAVRIAHDLTVDQLAEILLASLEFAPLDGVESCLWTLRSAGVKMAVVSNWDCSLPAVLTRCGLDGWFDAVVASAVVGREKPDPATWTPALEALGVAPREAWHVGDEARADGGGALAAGLRPVLVGGARLDGVTTIAALTELPALLESAGGTP